MTTLSDSPYSGTIFSPDTYKGGCAAKLCNEFFELPLKHSSKISIVVKASQGAEVLLYDEAEDSWTVKVALGAKNNTTSSIGLHANRDPATDQAYPTQVRATPRVLNANHFKAFTIQWRYGVVKVFDDGSDTPILTWKGPSDLRIGHFGVRSFGSSGVWRVQGGAEFNTTETNDIGGTFQHYKVNSGRFDFEVKGKQDAYIVLSKAPKDDVAAGLIHLVVGGWGGNRSGLWRSLAEVAHYDQVQTMSNFEYRRFWAEWDSTSVRFGVFGVQHPKMSYAWPTPIDDINYFGLISGMGNKIYWRVLEDGPEHDSTTAPPFCVVE